MPYEHEIVNLKDSIDARNFWNNISENDVTKSFKIKCKNNKIIIENLRKQNDRLKDFQNKLLKINKALVNFIKFKKYFE